jgi:rhamnose transport system permease protein
MLKTILSRREFSLLGVILLLGIVISFRQPRFLAASNIYDIVNDTTILIILSLAQFMVIVAAGIDLSLASTLAFSGMALGLLNRAVPGIPMIVILVLAIAIGVGLGAFNGFMIARAGIPAIIMTLGTMSIYRGFVFVMSGGEWVSADEMSESFRSFPRAGPFGFSMLVILAAVVIVLVYLFLNHTRTGREFFGVGGNRTASEYVGIKVRKVQFLSFVASGAIAGLSGLMWVSRYASAQNDTAAGFELQTVAACVIGGVSIMGGSGSVSGVVLGALFLGIVKNALTVTRISPFWQLAIQGFVILVAISLNAVLAERARERSLRRRRAL